MNQRLNLLFLSLYMSDKCEAMESPQFQKTTSTHKNTHKKQGQKEEYTLLIKVQILAIITFLCLINWFFFFIKKKEESVRNEEKSQSPKKDNVIPAITIEHSKITNEGENKENSLPNQTSVVANTQD